LLNLYHHGLGIAAQKKGNMDLKRLLELALETLESKRTEIERSIAEICEFRDGKKRVFMRTSQTSIVAVKQTSRTPAQRKAQSRRMKKIWAARKKQAAKPSPSKTKRKPMSRYFGQTCHKISFKNPRKLT
jgi:hypothetical protein